ncbi:MAG: sulfatase-like hydrolase/transferase [Blastocatellia bacterium]|nr:sulfatase-like hydrolase/transferase [Blastocatellia bacterium]
MKNSPILFLAARLCFGLFVLMTSIYCILAYIPFTYYHFLKFTHLLWLTAFVKIHPYLYWLAFAIVAATLRPDLEQPRTKKLTLAFFAFQMLAGVALLIRPLLPDLQNDITSFLWSLVALIPLLWVTVIDYTGHREEVKWAEPEVGEGTRIFRAAVLAALFVSLLYAGIFYARYIIPASAEFSPSQQIVAISWSLASHLLIFVAAFVMLDVIRAIATLFKTPPRMEFFLCNVLGALLLALALRTIVLAALSFTGALAHLFSILLAGSLIAFLSGLSIRLYRDANGPVTSGLELAIFPLTFGRITTYAGRVLWIAAITVLAYVLATKTALMDWNFLAQKLSVAAVWSVTFASFYAMISVGKAGRERVFVWLILAVVILVGYKTLDGSRNDIAGLTGDEKFDTSVELDRYTGMDVSFKLARDILTPVSGGGDLYRFLQENTNIPRTVEIKPVDLKMVQYPDRKEGGSITERSGRRKAFYSPNIFIFVVDSLRQDYLSPYNKKVTFTPAIESFARESVVMENAFTHYGATGLSEPSIWVGGMFPHQQYITPFYPMNSLQKLLEAEGYQNFISMDTILSVIVEPSPSIVELDEGLANKDFFLCRSLKDLQAKIDGRPDTKRPIFAYTQCQDIHISVINREGKSVPPGEEYPGFYAPYASRIRAMDQCFGEFIAHLKARGLYDNSIVVLTADHGDSLGEEGRWGHAYTIFPEVIRIPLIIHLPTEMKNRMSIDTKLIAFSTDITPSIYYLLGHRPIARNEIFGRPLFTESQQEQNAYLRENYLVASSYGAVYGILSNNGRRLYISDGVNYKDYYYDLEDDPAGTRNRVSSSIKAENEQLIRDHITAINRFFNFNHGN